MAVKTLVLLLVAGCATADFNNEQKQRPVTKVINLLKDMSAQLQKEQEQDETLFENFKCWCETYGKEKTSAIANANEMIGSLSSSIEEGTAKKAQLETDITQLDKEVKDKNRALEEASGIRTKESSEFAVNEKDLSASIGGLGGAVGALGAAHGEALSQESMLQVQNLLKKHVAEHQAMFHEKLSSDQHSALVSFMQQPVAAKSYASQSGAIFGILKGMKESFETNLQSSREDEKRAVTQFGMLKSAKGKELSAATEQVKANTAELADTEVKLASDKDGLEDTQDALAADTTFLDDLKSKCANMDKAWEARQKMRSDEMTAISETITILNDDEAHDTMSRSLGFIQLRRSVKRVQVHRQPADEPAPAESAALASAGNATAGNEAAGEQDVFATVKDNIDGLINNLKDTQTDEVKERDFCIEEINSNQDQTTAANNKKADLESRIEDLKSIIQSASDAIAAAKQEVHETHVAMKQAGGNRAAENKEFQQIVADARATQAILTKASARLKEFYASKASLLQRAARRQQPGAAAPEAPAGFGEYKKAGGAAGAMGLLEMIIKESKATETQALEEEQEAQSDYEGFMKDSFKTVDALSAEITDKSEQLAKANGEKTLADTSLAQTQDDLYNLGDAIRALHRRCDYLLDNFEVRQSSRAEEIDSLEQGKAMLSGANFGF